MGRVRERQDNLGPVALGNLAAFRLGERRGKRYGRTVGGAVSSEHCHPRLSCGLQTAVAGGSPCPFISQSPAVPHCMNPTSHEPEGPELCSLYK